MVQFNLLPDIKLEFVKARRMKYLLSFVSVIVGGVAITVFLFAFFFVNVVQKKSLSDLQTDITKYSNDLKSEKNLDKILTVQNQLGAVTTLHKTKPVASRLFGYLTQVTPEQASLTKLTVDFTQNTMAIGGKAPTLDSVSMYTDALKATKYRVVSDSAMPKPGDDGDVCQNIDGVQIVLPDNKSLAPSGDCEDPTYAFSKVVLEKVSRDDKGAVFNITLTYNVDIFTDTKEVQLVVPTGIQTNESNLFEVKT